MNRNPDTVIGEGSSFSGDLSAAGPVRIDGDCSGSIKSAGDIVVSAKANVKADLDGASAIIAGRVEGNIRVDGDLRVVHSAAILGNLEAGCIDMEAGSFVSGLLRIEGKQERGRKERSIS